MATTSTSDTTAWTTRRVRDRRVVAGGAWLTITLIPSNDRFQHAIGPGGKCREGSDWSGHGSRTGDGMVGRTPSCIRMADVGVLGVLPDYLCRRTAVSGAPGHRPARPGRRRGWRPGPAPAGRPGCCGRFGWRSPACLWGPAGPARVAAVATAARPPRPASPAATVRDGR